MARLSSANPPAVPDPTSINLTRLLARLDQTLNSHDPDVDSKLRRSSLEREKVGKNVEYARGLLLKLQQDALGIKVQNKKIETQTELANKGEALQRLRERLDELNELAEEETEDDSSEGEDLLGEDTPSEETDDQVSIEPTTPIQAEIQSEIPDPEPQTMEPPPHQKTSTLRNRQNREELFSSSQLAKATGASTGLSTATAEAILTHNRTEQETLTNSLLSMASALKESSRAFATSLEDEKSTLDKTTEGLDKNEQGLEAASRRMGYLRTMTEGKGWWGRMMMYGWIALLMFIAIALVFVGPKFRF